MGFTPFGSGLKKFADRVGKLLMGLGLESMIWRQSAQNLDSQGFARKILRRWDLAMESSAGERVERYSGRVCFAVGILLTSLLRGARLDVTGECGKAGLACQRRIGVVCRTAEFCLSRVTEINGWLHQQSIACSGWPTLNST